MPAEPRSAWFYVSIGCVALLVVSVVTVVTALWLGLDTLRSAVTELQEPEGRERAAKRILGAETLPEGYRAGTVLALPFVFELVVLHEVPEQDHVFVFLTRFGGTEELADYLEGRKDPFALLEAQQMRFERGERLARGEIEVGATPMRFVSYRGRLDLPELPDTSGIVTLISIGCEDDDRLRLGVWSGPDPAPGSPARTLDLAGSVADARAIGEFLAPFRLCSE